MRQLSFAAAAGVALFARSADAAGKCDGEDFGSRTDADTSDLWYDIANFCGRAAATGDYPGTVLTAAALLECADALTSGTFPAANADLETLLSDDSSDCVSCVLDYANDVRRLFLAAEGTIVEDCGADGVWENADLITFNSVTCVRYLYEALNSFNDCSGVTADLRTGATSTRCAYEDFYAWEAEYRPLEDYLEYGITPANDVPTNTSDNVPDDCAACFTAFHSSIGADDEMESICMDESAMTVDDDCVTYETVADAVNALAVCTGGSTFRAGGGVELTAGGTPDVTWDGAECSDNDILFLDTFRPYVVYAECAADLVDGTDEFDACVAESLGIQAIGSFDCEPCLSNLILEINDKGHAKCVTQGPQSEDCLTSLTGRWKPLDDFYYCTGFRMNTDATQCTEAEVSVLGDMYKSFIPIFETALEQESAIDALTAITDHLEYLDTEISGLSCASCFNRLSVDMYDLIQSTTLLSAVCGNAYSADCETALEDVLATFEDCAGFAPTTDSAYQCTDDEVEAINNSALVVSTYQLATGSLSSVQSLYSLNAKVDILAESLGTELRCSHCFIRILSHMASMDEDDLAKCDDLESTDCLLVLGSQLREFHACAGFQFIDSSQETTTTAAPTTEATTTEATTTDSTATTSTKSAVLASTFGVAIATAFALVL